MITAFLSAIAAFALLAYWTACRKASLAYQTKATALMEQYFKLETVDESEIRTLYWAYRLARSWFFMPLLVLLIPLVFCRMVFLRSTEKQVFKKRSKEHLEIMDNILFMSIVKNPLLSIACLAGVYLSVSTLLTAGLIFRKLTRMPSLSSMVELLAVKAERRKELAIE